MQIPKMPILQISDNDFHKDPSQDFHTSIPTMMNEQLIIKLITLKLNAQ